MVKEFSKILRDDYEVMHFAICKETYNINFVSKRLGNCKDLAILAVMQNGLCLEYLSLKLRGDRDIVKIAIKQYPWVIRYASKELQEDKYINLYARRYLDNPC